MVSNFNFNPLGRLKKLQLLRTWKILGDNGKLKFLLLDVKTELLQLKCCSKLVTVVHLLTVQSTRNKSETFQAKKEEQEDKENADEAKVNFW